jgi:hypothetical protein
MPPTARIPLPANYTGYTSQYSGQQALGLLRVSGIFRIGGEEPGIQIEVGRLRAGPLFVAIAER